MKRWFKKFAAVFAALCVLVCSIPLGGSVVHAAPISGLYVYGYGATTQTEVMRRIGEIHSVLPGEEGNHAYFTVSGNACSHSAGSTCSGCNFKNVMNQRLGIKPLRSGAAYTCFGFGCFVYEYLFRESIDNAQSIGTVSNASNSTMTANIAKIAKPGDVLYYYSGNTKVHTAIYLGTSGGSIQIYEGNANNKKWGVSAIHYGTIIGNISQFTKICVYGNKAYHQNDTSSGDNTDTDGCSTSYQGWYMVTAQALALRGGHGGSSVEYTTLPYGTVIYISKASGPSGVSGNWGHTVYQNQAGCVAMRYVTPTNAPGNNPQGCVDTIYGDMYSVWLSGWAFDMDSTRSQLDIAVFIDDAYAGTIQANRQRTDVNDAYPGVGLYHGFDYFIHTDNTGYHKVDVYAINVGEGDNTCLGTYYLTILKDEEAPVISDVQVTDRTSTGYTVTCTVTDNYYLDRVQFPTWTLENGQDDIAAEWWSNASATGTRNGNTWSFRVNTADHNNETGDYLTHIYAYDKETYTCVSVGVVNIDATPPVISNVEVTDISPAGYTVRCTVTDNDAVDRVQFPTWTTENGQDDLLPNWNTEPAASGTYLGDNVYEFRVNASDHNNEVGIYSTHIYAWDACGNSSSVQYELPVINDIDTRALLGDANRDGRVNSQDVMYMRRALLGMESAVPLAIGDLNGDGRVNLQDVMALRWLILKNMANKG